jgi:hypothetical protein
MPRSISCEATTQEVLLQQVQNKAPPAWPKKRDLNILKVQLKGLWATNQKLFMIYLRKERAPMPITKARLDRLIDMLDSAWLKRRDSQNTNPKQFFESPSARNPTIAEPPNMPQEDSARRKDLFR